MERQTDCGSETSTFRGNNLNCVNFKPMESESIHCERRQYSSWNQDAQFRFAAKKDIQAMVEYFQYMAGATRGLAPSVHNRFSRWAALPEGLDERFASALCRLRRPRCAAHRRTHHNARAQCDGTWR